MHSLQVRSRARRKRPQGRHGGSSTAALISPCSREFKCRGAAGGTDLSDRVQRPRRRIAQCGSHSPHTARQGLHHLNSWVEGFPEPQGLAQISELLVNWKPEGLTPRALPVRNAGPGNRSRTRRWRVSFAAPRSDCTSPARQSLLCKGGASFSRKASESAESVQTNRFRPETQFMIGSSTKPLTTLMMARLVAAGNFEWSTPVTRLLPDFALADSELTNRLQMRHTVSASTGMPRRDLHSSSSSKESRPSSGYPR